MLDREAVKELKEEKLEKRSAIFQKIFLLMTLLRHFVNILKMMNLFRLQGGVAYETINDIKESRD